MLERLSGEEKLYSKAIERITPEIVEAATDAELERRGGGLEFVLAELSRLELASAQSVSDADQYEEGTQ